MHFERRTAQKLARTTFRVVPNCARGGGGWIKSSSSLASEASALAFGQPARFARGLDKQVCLSDGQPDRGLKHTMCTGPGQVVDPTRLRAGLSQLTLAWAPRPAPVQWWEEEGGLHEGWVVSTDEYLMGSCEGEGRYVFLEVCEFYCGFHE